MQDHAQERPRPDAILLVEDEDPFRCLVQTILESHGYKVLDAHSPHEALHTAGNYRGRIGLLISDMVMPHMSAPELARSLQAANPDMRVLLISKYKQGSVVMGDGWRFLRKPFAPEVFVASVQELMNQAPAPRAAGHA